jgi:hypothetical protein
MTTIKIPPIKPNRSRLSLSEIIKILLVQILAIDHIANPMFDLSEITQGKIQGELHYKFLPNVQRDLIPAKGKVIKVINMIIVWRWLKSVSGIQSSMRGEWRVGPSERLGEWGRQNGLAKGEWGQVSGRFAGGSCHLRSRWPDGQQPLRSRSRGCPGHHQAG